jgi:hypothetical protein
MQFLWIAFFVCATLYFPVAVAQGLEEQKALKNPAATSAAYTQTALPTNTQAASTEAVSEIHERNGSAPYEAKAYYGERQPYVGYKGRRSY